jgi:hypothetical protein
MFLSQPFLFKKKPIELKYSVHATNPEYRELKRLGQAKSIKDAKLIIKKNKRLKEEGWNITIMKN